MPETGVVPCIKVKVAVVSVKGFIAFVKVAVIALLMTTPVALTIGMTELTIGAVVSGAAPVVKLHTLLAARALPAKSLAPVVIVAVYKVLAARLDAGVKVAATPTEVTVPETDVVPCIKVKVAVLSVEGSIASVKVTVIALLVATPVALTSGNSELTMGAVLSGTAPVVKLQT